ncbi:MAG: radical SAM protein [Nitrospirae bacterium]|nr:radical SAM protein [Nitrospirota bacterium]
MKILLLNPPSPRGEKFTREGRCTQQSAIWTTLWPPISLVYIGTLLRDNGHEVKVIDCPAQDIDINDVTHVIRAFCPAAVIWSVATPSIAGDLNFSSVVKQLNTGTYTIVFGTHVTVIDKTSLEQSPSLDIVVRNEPEITIMETITALEKPNGLSNLTSLPGITFRNAEGKITRNTPREFIADIDALPFPDWSLIDVNSYRLPLSNRPFLMVMPQRGCHFPCTFCTGSTYYGRKLRIRKVDLIVKEMKEAVERFAIRDFFFWAETFTANPSFVRALCNAIIDNNLGVSWVCNSRIDTVDGELLYLMRQAGCWMVSYGIESFDPDILKGVRKDIEVSRINQVISLTREAGILASAHVIFGLPHETPATALETKRRVLELELDFAQFYCAVPFPGSALYEQAVKEGWLDNITALDFAGFRQERAVMSLDTITRDEVEAIRARAVREFYLRPRIILGILRLTSFRHIGKTLLSAIKFFSPVKSKVK